MIRGNLDRLHLGDLLQWLQMGGLTGRLTLTVEGRQRRLDLLEGRIVFASSTVPDERLASWLAHEGVLPATRLRQCLGYSLLRRTFLTQVLIEDAGLTAEALKLSITRLAEAITTRVLFAPRVEFEFDPGYPIRDFLGLVVDLEPNALLMEAARRTDESRHEAAQREEEILPFTGEAFDKFFWSIIREGVSGGELLDGERFVELHLLIRNIMATLAQWLATSPGLVPLPSSQATGISEQLRAGNEVRLDGLPHAAWNQAVLACSIRSGDLGPPGTLGELEAHAAELDLWMELAGSEAWHRPHADRLDELTSKTVSLWSRSAAAAAHHLEVDPDAARFAAHLLSVPTDLVLWVLATLPVPHQNLRHTLLRRLPRRVGAGLASRADFPEALRVLWECTRATPLGACLHLARQTLPSASVWPDTIPTDESLLLEIASPSALTEAATAALEALEDIPEEPVAVG